MVMRVFRALLVCFWTTATADAAVVSWAGVSPGDVGLRYSASRALVIGSGHYDHWRALPGAIDDAKRVGEELKKHGFHVQLETSESDGRTGNTQKLTADRIRQKLREFFQETESLKDARLLVWFAGHGDTFQANNKNFGLIVGADAPLSTTDKAETRKRSLELDDLESMMLKSAAKHILFVFDACFAGSIFANTANKLPAAWPPIAISAQHRAMLFLTSGSADQVVPDKSVFAQAFIDAITGDGDADYDRDTFITATELSWFITQSVFAKAIPQTPQFGPLSRFPDHQRGDFIFLPSNPPAKRLAQGPVLSGVPVPSPSHEADAEERWKRVDKANKNAVGAFMKHYQGTLSGLEARAVFDELTSEQARNEASEKESRNLVDSCIATYIPPVGKHPAPVARVDFTLKRMEKMRLEYSGHDRSEHWRPVTEVGSAREGDHILISYGDKHGMLRLLPVMDGGYVGTWMAGGGTGCIALRFNEAQTIDVIKWGTLDWGLPVIPLGKTGHFETHNGNPQFRLAQ